MMPESKAGSGEQGGMDAEWRYLCVSAVLGARRFVRELARVVASGDQGVIDELLERSTQIPDVLRRAVAEFSLLVAGKNGARVLRTIVLSSTDAECVRVGVCLDAGSGLYLRVGLGMVLEEAEKERSWVVAEFGADLAEARA